MGSTPEFLVHRLPRAGRVAPNAAIVLEGLSLGGRPTFAVRIGSVDVDVVVEEAQALSWERFASNGRYYLVRPTTGEWPHGGTVAITCVKPAGNLQVQIGTVRDLAAPSFTSLSAPAPRTLTTPHGPEDVIALEHAIFDDAASPIVLVTLDLTTGSRTGAVKEGQAGLLTFRPDDQVGDVLAITLVDAAGNSQRIVRPYGPSLEKSPADESGFTSVAGTLAPIPGAEGAFIGTSDSGSANGFSRGHYLTSQSYDSDLEITVSATRLTEEHEMPIELAFRGGFFGVTGASSWYLYEHDGHWTGWKPTPNTVSAGALTLRVVQRGQQVTGYVNGEVAGSFVLERPVVAAPVGVHFKGHANKEARIQFSQFDVRTISAN